MADMKPPQRGKPPKRIEASGPPGGPYTPGARRGKPMPPREERQRRATQGIRARRGLTPMLQQEGADAETIEAARLIESMPGGPELLYSYAAEQLLNKAGAAKKDTKKVRLYRIGGSVQDKGNRYSSTTRGVGSGGRQLQDSEYGYQRGGLAQAAQRTREGGRGDDSILLHMTPEEFEVIQSMWGQADINPNTGLPEYGFLSKIWKKVKKAVKKVFSSKIFQIVAPIALSIFAPGLGTALGGALGLGSGTAASVVGNALIRGGMSAAGGGDFVTGAIQGAVTGGLGDVAGGVIKDVAPGLSDSTAALAGSALTGGAAAELTGGDFVSGAMTGALGQMTQPMMEGIAEKGRGIFGLQAPEQGGILATRMTPEQRAAVAAGRDPTVAAPVLDEGLAPGEMGPPAPLGPEGLAPGEMGPPAPPPGTGPTVTPPGAPAPAGDPGFLERYGLPLMGALGAMGGGEYEEGAPPEIPPHMLEPLPIYESTRQFIGPTDPNAYYTYGMAGAPQTGESLFITPDPFAGEVGTPTTGGLEAAGAPVGQGVQGMIATGQVIPGNMVRGQGGMLRNAGYTQGRDGNWYPPGQQQLGQGTGFAMGGMHEQRFQRGGEFDYWEQNADVPRAIPTVSRAGGYTRGPGSGRSDEIPARLSDGEYVIDAETVALLGDGSGKHGAERLDEMRRNLRKHKATNLKKGEFTHKARSPEGYMPRLRAAAGRA